MVRSGPITGVQVSTDGGSGWRAATLGPAAGRWAWRPWSLTWEADEPGPTELLCRATDGTGTTQPVGQGAPPEDLRGSMSGVGPPSPRDPALLCLMPTAPTPAVAALVRANVPHTLHPYHHDPATTAFGDEVVAALGWDPERVFKTLVASVDGSLTVGIVPVAAHLDLKALAAAAGGKRAQMAKVADAERSSGYVAGGISPLGQRKALPTVIDRGVTRFDTVLVSAGKRGLQVELPPTDLIRLCRAKLAAISA